MNYHRWSSLLRGYVLTLRYNQLILVVTTAGFVLGFIVGGDDIGGRVWQAIAVGATVFLAGAVAKELDPDHPQAGLPAAAIALLLAATTTIVMPVALFWMLGGLRILNRSTGLRPKSTDLLALLLITGWLCWQETPLFGILMGILLIMDSLLPDRRRILMVIGMLVLAASGLWMIARDVTVVGPAPLYVLILLLIVIGFIAVILGSYRVDAVGDETGERLTPLRVQAGQIFALIAGLLMASLLGDRGIILFIGLWAALLGALVYHLALAFNRRSVASL